jgi:hypothetical protein
VRKVEAKKHPTMSIYPLEKIIQDYNGGMSLHQIHNKYGISTTYAYHILVKRGGKIRTISEAMLNKEEGWRKLVPVKGGGGKYKSTTRIVSLPFQILKELGYKPHENLQGKWKLESGELSLSIRRKLFDSEK